MNNDKYTEMEINTIESRRDMRLLAAIIHTQHNGKLPMQDCLQAAEGMLTEALIADSAEVRRFVDAERARDKQVAPVMDKLQ